MKEHRFNLHITLFFVGATAMLGGCQSKTSNFVMIRADRAVAEPSAFPVAIDPARVGTYPADTKSGAGYFYDDVLEYRVWFPSRARCRPAER